MNLKLLALFFLVAVLIVPMQYAHGHGLGMDTIKSINIGSKKIMITVHVIPTNFDDNAEKRIAIVVSDAVTNLNINDVTLTVGLHHEGSMVFEDSFFSDNGMFVIKVEPSNGEQPEITGARHPELDAWYATESSPSILVGPVFDSGGLYNFEIERIAITESGGVLENLSSFFADVTVTTSHAYDERDKEGNPVSFGVMSYYDEVTSLDYDPDTNSVTFEMPFDWREQNISHIPVVHEELHFPKSFGDFFAPSYVGKMNGIELFKSSVVIDDYSNEDERIVHVVLSQDNLRYLKQAQKNTVTQPENMRFTLEPNNNLVFPIIAMTKDAQVQVDLSWDPPVIEPGKNTKFIYTFRNANTGELLRNTQYDFVISQDGEDLYKKSGNAQIGSDFVDYAFSESQKGQISIRFDNLQGAGRSTEFAVTVVPEFGQLAVVMLSIAVASSLILGSKIRIR